VESNWVHSARRPLIGLLQPAPVDDDDDREFGGMKTGSGNRSIRGKPVPAPLCPLQIPLDQTRDRTRAAAVGSQRLTAWAMARPWGSEGIGPDFLDLGISWRCGQLHVPTADIHWTGGWVDPRAGLDDAEKRKFLTLPGLEFRPLGRPAYSQSLYRLGYPGSLKLILHNKNQAPYAAGKLTESSPVDSNSLSCCRADSCTALSHCPHGFFVSENGLHWFELIGEQEALHFIWSTK
jgi:hypothetical protein